MAARYAAEKRKSSEIPDESPTGSVGGGSGGGGGKASALVGEKRRTTRGPFIRITMAR